MIKQLDPKYFLHSLRGLEKENLRVDLDGHLSQVSHEDALKTSASDPHYTLDFAECQLEVITQPHQSIDDLLAELKMRYHYVYQNIQPELLWPYSMPPDVSDADIKIAHFGNDKAAQEKTLYRQGLVNRYGKMMQIISGIHYNFSLAPEFFKAYQKLKPNLSLIELQNEVYFKMIHYYLERYWLLIYLFGASPIAFANSLRPDTKAAQVLKPVTDRVYLAPYATSIRQSDLGYHNPKNCELMICFKDLDCYIRTLEKATSTPYSPYEKIPQGSQLNANYLQIENEFYAPIRPKQILQQAERPLEALKARGVAYLEVRALDLNPFSPLGVVSEQLAFIELLLLAGLFQEPLESCESFGRLTDNALKVSLAGRDPNLKLKMQGQEILLTDWANLIIKELESVAEFLQNDLYHQAIKFAKNLILQPELLPSAKLAREAHDYKNFILHLAQQPPQN